MKNKRLIFSTICIVFFIIFIISLSVGSCTLRQLWQDIFIPPQVNTLSIFWDLRLPRTLTAATCGGLLAVAGVMMQLLLQNPLADPYILGTSSAAAFVTLLLISLGVGDIAYITGGWLGSILGISLILLFARQHRFQAQALLLIGIALASGFSAAISFLLLLSNSATLHALLFWLAGDLNDTQYPWLGLCALISGLILLRSFAPGLNLLLRGEAEASVLGLPLYRYKLCLFFASALFTAIAVTLSGCLGFIGLIIPHLTRRIIGHDHRNVIPLAAAFGASLLMTADILARTILAPQQLPVGIFITLIGVPVFIWMLQTCKD